MALAGLIQLDDAGRHDEVEAIFESVDSSILLGVQMRRPLADFYRTLFKELLESRSSEIHFLAPEIVLVMENDDKVGTS